MKKALTLICLLFSALFLINSETAALETAGCLTCHNFAGLVRLEEGDLLKVLHINREAYLDSPHGAFRCKECHVEIVSIPHNGFKKVNCKNGCHKEKKDKELIKKDNYSTIHKGQQSLITRLESDSPCNDCHSIYPHSKEVFKRAVLNLHTGYISCEVCHLDRKKYEVVDYKWDSGKEVEFKGRPYGNFFDNKTNKRSAAVKRISKLTSYVEDDGKVRPTILILKEIANKAITHADNETINGRDDLWHRHIVKIDLKLVCKTCHTSDSIIDFTKLGYNGKRTGELTSKNVVTIISDKKVFHLPKVF